MKLKEKAERSFGFSHFLSGISLVMVNGELEIESKPTNQASTSGDLLNLE